MLFYVVAPDAVPLFFEALAPHYLVDRLNRLGHEAYLAGGKTDGALQTPNLTYERIEAHFREGRRPIVITTSGARPFHDLTFGVPIYWSTVIGETIPRPTSYRRIYTLYPDEKSEKRLYLDLFTPTVKNHPVDWKHPKRAIGVYSTPFPGQFSLPTQPDIILSPGMPATEQLHYLKSLRYLFVGHLTPFITLARLIGTIVVLPSSVKARLAPLLDRLENPEIGIALGEDPDTLQEAYRTLFCHLPQLWETIHNWEKSLDQFLEEARELQNQPLSHIWRAESPLLSRLSLPYRPYFEKWQLPPPFLADAPLPRYFPTAYENFCARIQPLAVEAESIAEAILQHPYEARIIFLTFFLNDDDPALLFLTRDTLHFLLYREWYWVIAAPADLLAHPNLQDAHILHFPVEESHPPPETILKHLIENGILADLLVILPLGAKVHPLLPFFLAEAFQRGAEVIFFEHDYTVDGKRIQPIFLPRQFDFERFIGTDSVGPAVAFANRYLQSLPFPTDLPLPLLRHFWIVSAYHREAATATINVPLLTLRANDRRWVAETEARARLFIDLQLLPSVRLQPDPEREVIQISPSAPLPAWAVLIAAAHAPPAALLATLRALDRYAVSHRDRLAVVVAAPPIATADLFQNLSLTFTDPGAEDLLDQYRHAAAAVSANYLLCLEAGIVPETNASLERLFVLFALPRVAAITPLLLESDGKRILELGLRPGGRRFWQLVLPNFFNTLTEEASYLGSINVPHRVPAPSPRVFAIQREALFSGASAPFSSFLENFLNFVIALSTQGRLILAEPRARFLRHQQTILARLGYEHEIVYYLHTGNEHPHFPKYFEEAEKKAAVALWESGKAPLWLQSAAAFPNLDARTPDPFPSRVHHPLWNHLPKQRKRLLFLFPKEDPISEIRWGHLMHLMTEKGWFSTFRLELGEEFPTLAEIALIAPDIIIVCGVLADLLPTAMRAWRQYLSIPVIYIANELQLLTTAPLQYDETANIHLAFLYTLNEHLKNASTSVFPLSSPSFPLLEKPTHLLPSLPPFLDLTPSKRSRWVVGAIRFFPFPLSSQSRQILQSLNRHGKVVLFDLHFPLNRNARFVQFCHNDLKIFEPLRTAIEVEAMGFIHCPIFGAAQFIDLLQKLNPDLILLPTLKYSTIFPEDLIFWLHTLGIPIAAEEAALPSAPWVHRYDPAILADVESLDRFLTKIVEERNRPVTSPNYDPILSLWNEVIFSTQ